MNVFMMSQKKKKGCQKIEHPFKEKKVKLFVTNYFTPYSYLNW